MEIGEIVPTPANKLSRKYLIQKALTTLTPGMSMYVGQGRSVYNSMAQGIQSAGVQDALRVRSLKRQIYLELVPKEE